MKRSNEYAHPTRRIEFAIVAIVASWLLALPLADQRPNQSALARSQGQNGVYNPTCNKGNPGAVGFIRLHRR